jgi:hypothetical protein
MFSFSFSSFDLFITVLLGKIQNLSSLPTPDLPAVIPQPPVNNATPVPPTAREHRSVHQRLFNSGVATAGRAVMSWHGHDAVRRA